MDKRGGLECVCVCVWVWGGGGGGNFGVRKALIGRIYTSFYVVPKRTIAYDSFELWSSQMLPIYGFS